MADENVSNKKHFLDGLNDVPTSDPLGQLLMLDPSKYAIFWEDFTEVDYGDYPTDSDAVALKYAVTLDAEADYDVSFGGATGALVLTTEGGDTEGGQWRLNASPFQLTSGKKAWFKTKFNIDAGSGGTIGKSSLYLGLAKNQTGTNFIADAGTSFACDNMWGIASLATEAGVDVMVVDNDEQTVTTDIATLVDETNVELGLYYDGTDTHYYVNGVKGGTVSGTHPTGDAMTVMIHFKSQEAIAKVLTLDYVFVAIER